MTNGGEGSKEGIRDADDSDSGEELGSESSPALAAPQEGLTRRWCVRLMGCRNTTFDA